MQQLFSIVFFFVVEFIRKMSCYLEHQAGINLVTRKKKKEKLIHVKKQNKTDFYEVMSAHYRFWPLVVLLCHI